MMDNTFTFTKETTPSKYRRRLSRFGGFTKEVVKPGYSTHSIFNGMGELIATIKNHFFNPYTPFLEQVFKAIDSSNIPMYIVKRNGNGNFKLEKKRATVRLNDDGTISFVYKAVNNIKYSYDCEQYLFGSVAEINEYLRKIKNEELKEKRGQQWEVVACPLLEE